MTHFDRNSCRPCRDFCRCFIANHGLAAVASNCRPVGTESQSQSQTVLHFMRCFPSKKYVTALPAPREKVFDRPDEQLLTASKLHSPSLNGRCGSEHLEIQFKFREFRRTAIVIFPSCTTSTISEQTHHRTTSPPHHADCR